MLATLLTLGVLAQGPTAATPAALAGPLEAVPAKGEAELSEADALASARRAAEELLRDRLRERAERVAAAQAPFWLPAPVLDHAVERWLLELPVDQLARVVDRTDQRREHEFGSSFQTTLYVVEDARAAAGLERQWRRELRLLERRTLGKAGGIVVAWALLGLLVGWLDRLSRGYMTGRLWLCGLLAGAAVPVLALVL